LTSLPVTVDASSKRLRTITPRSWRRGTTVDAVQLAAVLRDAHSMSVSEVRFTSAEIIVTLTDGAIVGGRLSDFPRLMGAAAEERLVWERSAGGRALHWPALDEDISVVSLLPPPARRLYEFVEEASVRLKVGRMLAARSVAIDASDLAKLLSRNARQLKRVGEDIGAAQRMATSRKHPLVVVEGTARSIEAPALRKADRPA
jgi:hypothetical protein